MKSRVFSFLMIMVHILSVNCRPFAPNVGECPPLDQSTMEVEQSVRGAMGSNPPSCEHKCYGCNPCEATQVPTISGYVGVAIQDSNYKPEGWKCKCGRTFYSP